MKTIITVFIVLFAAAAMADDYSDLPFGYQSPAGRQIYNYEKHQRELERAEAEEEYRQRSLMLQREQIETLREIERDIERMEMERQDEIMRYGY